MSYYKPNVQHITFIAIFSMISWLGHSQTTNIDSLLQVRSELIQNNASTKEVDMLMHQQGHNPKCIIQQTSPTTFTFTPYQGPYNEQREQKMNLRLKTHYSFLDAIVFSNNFQQVQIISKETLTPYMIQELVSHFGYDGYEIH